MASRSSFRRLRWLAVPLLLVASVGAVRIVANAVADAAAVNLTQYVDPLIGTDIGATTPAAATPFGMVQIGPDTPDHGYHYPDRTIADFSATHMSGAGCNNKGDVQFLPFVGEIGAAPGPVPPSTDHQGVGVRDGRAGDRRTREQGVPHRRDVT